MKVILFFIFLAITVEANYCIQVQSSVPSAKELLIKEAKSNKYTPFTDVRVEERNPYFVLRVGNYEHYKDAVKVIKKIRHIEDDAYIRKCELHQDEILYIRNKTYQEDISIEPKIKESVQKEEKYVEDSNISVSKTPIAVEEISIGVEDKPIAEENTELPVKSQLIEADNSVINTKQEEKVQEKPQYTAFEALAKAFGASNEGNKKEAYNFFTEAIDKCSDASIYNKACMGAILNAPLRRKNIDDPYYVTLFGTAMWYTRAYQPETAFQKNFNDTVYQLKIRAGKYMDENKTISLYLFAHLDGDINSKAGSIPVIYSDNYTGVGIGADYRFSPYSRLFIETSFENNLIHDNGTDNTQFDYRAGIDFYKRWGPATNLSCSYNPTLPLKWFSDLYAAAVFYSRYNNNMILQSSARVGIQFLTYRMSTLGAYAYVGITADSNGDYYNNIMEIGPGLEYKPYEPIPFAIRSEYRFSKFFKNVPDGETDRFNTLLIYGIFYFEQ